MFDVTDVVMVAIDTEGTVVVGADTAAGTEAIGVLDAVGMATTGAVAESVVMVTEGVTGRGSEEATEVVAIIGGTDVVEGTDAIVTEATVAEETTLVLIIGVTTCGDVVRTKTAATGA